MRHASVAAALRGPIRTRLCTRRRRPGCRDRRQRPPSSEVPSGIGDASVCGRPIPGTHSTPYIFKKKYAIQIALVGDRLEALGLVDEVDAPAVADVLLIGALNGVAMVVHVELAGPRHVVGVVLVGDEG